MTNSDPRGTNVAAGEARSIRIEEAIFGKYISEPGGPFVGKEYGYLARSSEFPKNTDEIDQFVRDVENQVSIDPDRKGKHMVFAMFGTDGFWSVQVRLLSNVTESGIKSRASTIARVRYLGGVRHWGELPQGLLLHLATEEPPETLVVGHPKEIPQFWLKPSDVGSASHEFEQMLKDSDVLLERFLYLHRKLSKSDLLAPVRVDVWNNDQLDDDACSLVIGVELECLRVAFAENGTEINAALAIHGLIEGASSGVIYSEQAKRLPVQQRVSENDRHMLKGYLKAAQGHGQIKRAHSPVSLIADQNSRKINRDPWIIEKFTR